MHMLACLCKDVLASKLPGEIRTRGSTRAALDEARARCRTRAALKEARARCRRRAVPDDVRSLRGTTRSGKNALAGTSRFVVSLFFPLRRLVFI
jgi:hypothetical protein